MGSKFKCPQIKLEIEIFIDVSQVEKLTNLERGFINLKCIRQKCTIFRSPSCDSYNIKWLATNWPHIDWNTVPESSKYYVKITPK